MDCCLTVKMIFIDASNHETEACYLYQEPVLRKVPKLTNKRITSLIKLALVIIVKAVFGSGPGCVRRNSQQLILES